PARHGRRRHRLPTLLRIRIPLPRPPRRVGADLPLEYIQRRTRQPYPRSIELLFWFLLCISSWFPSFLYSCSASAFFLSSLLVLLIGFDRVVVCVLSYTAN